MSETKVRRNDDGTWEMQTLEGFWAEMDTLQVVNIGGHVFELPPFGGDNRGVGLFMEAAYQHGLSESAARIEELEGALRQIANDSMPFPDWKTFLARIAATAPVQEAGDGG